MPLRLKKILTIATMLLVIAALLAVAGTFVFRFEPTARQRAAARELEATRQIKVKFSWEGIYIQVLAQRDIPLAEAKEIYGMLLPGEEEKQKFVGLNFYRCASPTSPVLWFTCDFRYQIDGNFVPEFKHDHY